MKVTTSPVPNIDYNHSSGHKRPNNNSNDRPSSSISKYNNDSMAVGVPQYKYKNVMVGLQITPIYRIHKLYQQPDACLINIYCSCMKAVLLPHYFLYNIFYKIY